MTTIPMTTNPITTINPMTKRRTEIFIAAASGAGHMGPNISLTVYLLQHKEVSVSLLLPLAESEQLPTATPPPSERFHIIRVKVPGDVREAFMAREALDESREDIVSDLISTCDLVNNPPAAIVYDMFAIRWATLLADTLHVPHFTFFPSPLTFVWFTQHWRDIGNRRNTVRAAPKEDEDTSVPIEMRMPPPMIGDVDIYMPGIKFAIKGSDLMDGPPAMIESFAQYFEAFYRSAGALVHDLPELYQRPEPLCQDIINHYNEEAGHHGLQRPHPYQLYCVGAVALYDHRLTAQTSDCARWLDHHEPRSVVLVALGSWGQIPLADVVELARGLELSGLKFLWAYRDRQPSFLPLAERETLEETDESGLPLNFRKDIEGRGAVHSWINQPMCLRHPAISCFVTHCGWNSSMEALSLAGVPLVLMPVSAEQGINANVLEQDWKCGRRMWDMRYDRQLERSHVAETLKECVGDETIYRNAQALKVKLERAAATGGSSTKSREDFINLLSHQQ